MWEYLIVDLPSFEPPTHAPGASAAVHALNEEGALGWEAVGMTPWPIGGSPCCSKGPDGSSWPQLVQGHWPRSPKGERVA